MEKELETVNNEQNILYNAKVTSDTVPSVLDRLYTQDIKKRREKRQILTKIYTPTFTPFLYYKEEMKRKLEKKRYNDDDDEDRDEDNEDENDDGDNEEEEEEEERPPRKHNKIKIVKVKQGNKINKNYGKNNNNGKKINTRNNNVRINYNLSYQPKSSSMPK